MDLDNIKKTWREADIKPAIDDEKIRKMISNEGQSAFGKLLSYEKFGLFMLIIFIPMGYFVFERYFCLQMLYVITALFGILWQLYKIKKLKKVDLQQMSITQVSKHINWYKKIIIKEISYGAVWFLAFFLILGYLDLSESTDHVLRRVVSLLIGMAVGLIGVVLTYKLLYLNNIKKLQASIKEIEDFEEDNKE